MASLRATPTLKMTMISAPSGWENEYRVSMPLISEITCSAGRVTKFSTSVGVAPGKGINTSAKVTSICGSSSFGVTKMANKPSKSPRSANSGVMALF